MKISIITVVWNNAKTIKDAIDSVLAQTYENIEYIVVDGASTDGTVEIVQSYGDKIDKFISEKDNGLYDAMNKGIGLSTGDVVGILNSDDFYKSNDILEIVANEFMSKDIDCLYGDLEYVDDNDTSKVIRYWKSKPFKDGLFEKGWHPAHPTFFVKREVYEKYGLFDLEMKISADFELMLRFLEKYCISTTYLPKVLVRMRTGGESNRSIKNIIAGNKSILRAFDKNGIKVNKLMYVFYRFVPKIIQMIKRGR